MTENEILIAASSIKNLKGLTVNEMLFHSNLMNEFDLAVNEKNLSKIKFILNALNLNHESIQEIIKKIAT
ncbi:hypothetical protein [Flavobacterium sp.]|uniref:hypothetical protein n=1 Tax=Flavobacterium sp. TaxID=239 RepID=UPI0025BE8660|nr:hypothetical protein [Flavobacterium sp.]